MADYELTTGTDTIVGTSGNDTVYATAATLNAGDQLTGGGGNDVLALYNSGTFRVDQLATFTGFSSITLSNDTSGRSELYLGSQTVSVTELGSGDGGHTVYLGSGAATIHNNTTPGPFSNPYNNYVYSQSSAAWNASNAIDSVSNLNLYGTNYDLTTNTLTNIGTVFGYGTIQINSATAAGVSVFSGYNNSKLVTANGTLDLSHTSVSGFTVASTNAIGTTFTVKNLSTALQIVGGSGQDSIVAQGFNFTAAQRDAIFHTASIETIVDASGTYVAPVDNANELTIGNDTVVGTSGNDTVYATAATLNAGDQLTGGGGNDVLALYNSGTFRVDQLATFTGFSSITLSNDTSGRSELYLGSQTVSVTELGSGDGGHTVYLGSGAATIHNNTTPGPFSNPYNNYVYSQSSAAWNASNAIDSVSNLNLYGTNYDLTTNTLTNIGTVFGYGTIQINSATAAGVSVFSGYNNSKLVTANGTLDLSHTSVSGFTVASTNAIGTTFTVKNLSTALQIVGGSGQDSIVAQGFNFTAAQRDAIFHTASIETIVDASGTYVAPVDNANELTIGNDTVVGTSGNDTVYATAATLNAGDQLTGGGGNDVLALYNSGTFRVDQLATFTGFSSITLSNDTSGRSELYLGSQTVSVTELGSGDGGHTVYLGSGAATIRNNTTPGPFSNPYNNYVYSQSSAAWNASNAINSVSNLNLYGTNYDLTTNTLTNIGTVFGYGTIQINSATAAGVSVFSGYNNSKLVTANGTLDLSHTSVSGFTVASTNAIGTTFTVKNLSTALQIVGGSGQDSIVAQGFNFTAAQRDAIFHTASIETIVDASGTYSVVPGVTATLANDTGSSSTDKITSVPTLTGTGDANAVVHFTVDGNAIAATATADASGAWTFTPTGLANGAHTIVASETDAAGNATSTSLTFTLDTTAPAVTARLANDTGSSSTDKITSVPTLTGTGDANAVVHFTVDGNAIAATATADASGTWTFTPTGLANGAHTIVASETDAAGNATSTSLTFTLDTTAPAVTARLANDTGSSSTDKITSVPTLTGTGDANAVVHFTVDGNAIAATATADASGAWTFTPTGLANGAHTIVASETDAAGNATSTSLTFTLEGSTATPIETSGVTRLDQVANEFYLRDSAGNGPSLKYAGADFVAGQFGAWTPIGVEKVGSGYQVVLKYGSTDQYLVWNLDSNGNCIGNATGVVSGSEYAFQSLEAPFHQDLNADGTTGLKTTPIETSGVTRLDQVANEFYLRDSAGNGPSLKYAGADFVAGQFGAWTPIGVEKVGSGYQVVLKYGSTDQYLVWNLDSNGNCIGNATGVVSGSEYAFQSLEAPFHQDLNADGTTGLKTTPIETSGVTRLDQVANEFYLRDSASNGPSLKYAGADFVAGQFGAWTPIGVEKVGSGYQVVLKYGSTDQYLVWNLDSNGNCIGNATGVVSGSEYAFQSLEAPFHQDLNADGTTGLKTTPIETSGVTRLDQVANEFYLRDSAGNGPSLKYAGADFVAGQFGAWTPIGVEKVGSGYQVVLKYGSTDQYLVWNLDSNGNCIGNATGVVSGSEYAFQSLEAPFHQDLNADGTTGLKTTPIETSGVTRLDQVANEFYLRDSASNGPSLKYAGADFVAGQFGAWTPIGVEKVGSGYQVVLKYGSTDQYLVWNLDSNGNCIGNATGVVSGSEYAFQSLEAPFHQDLNADGTTGLKTTPIETSGVTRLDQVANEFYLRDSASNGPSLKYAGADFVAGQFGAWTPIGVEKVGSGYQVVLKYGSTDQYLVWNLDSNGNCIGNATGVVSGSYLSIQFLETTFQQDLNGDGVGPAVFAIAAASADKVEGQSGTMPFTFTITRTGDTGSAHSVSWSLTGSGANPASASDFSGNALPSGTVSFAAGETSKTVTVNVVGDTVVEASEGFTVTLSNPSTGATLGTASAIGTIRNDDAVLSIATASADKAEGESGTMPFTFTITRTGDTGSAHSVSWSLTGSGANPASASDFVGNALPSGTVSFAAGETSKTVTVNVAGDTVVEASEGFTVTLSNPSIGATLGTGSAVGTIRNDDAVLSIAAASADKVEGQSGTMPFTFTITRTGDTGSAHSVSWSLTGSGANPASASDFSGNALPSGTVSFAAGETSKTVTVNVVGDTVVEASEGFTVTLSNPSIGATLGTGSAVGTIRNDDAVLSIATASADKAEGNSGTTPFTFTITRTGDTGTAHSVSWSLTGSGASPASAADFSGNVLPSGVVTFAAGETSKTVTVNVAGDTVVESDDGFTVTLSNPSTGATLGTASAIGTIRSDDTSSPGTGGDNAAPVLQSISLSTSQLDFGSGQKSLVVTAHLSDDISGLSDGIGGAPVQILFRSPSGAQVWGTFDIQHPVSGNQLDGTFQATIQLPANAEAGNWTVQTLFISDEAGNTKYLSPADTPALSSAAFQVLNSASDGTAPVLQSISLSTSQLDFGSGQKSLVVTAHLSDDISGLSDGIGGAPVQILFRSPSGAQVWGTFDIQHPVSGNQLDGTFQATIQLPANAEAGNWTVQTLFISDEAGNTKYLSPADTPALSSAAFQVLNSASDGTAPVLQSISLSTSQLDFGSGQKSLVVTAHLSDDISGLSDGIGGAPVQILFRSPSGAQVWGTFDIQHPVSGNQLDGTFQATIQLPANAEAGNWTVQTLFISDEAGNTKYLSPADTPALSSAAFQVLNSASDGTSFSVEPAQASQSEGESGTMADTFVATLGEDNGSVLTPSDGQSHDSFDGAAALSSDGLTAIVGSWSDDIGANTDQGSARVFVQDGGDWTQRGAALTASDGQAEDLFGASVALSSDGRTAIIGGPGDDVGGHGDQGSARVLAWDGNAWTQRGGAITPGDGQAGDHFGVSVALSSDGLTVIVGGPQHDVGANMDQGSAYVFAWDGSEWIQRGDALTFSEGGSGSHLGSSVALSSDGLTATVSASGDNAPLVLHWDGFHWI